MAVANGVGSLTTAFSGLGVEESDLLTTLGKWRPEERKSFRKSTPDFFSEDERQFERWNEDLISMLSHEFLRFKCAIVLWTMHPWERDARLMKEAITKGQEGYSLIIEIACTRSSEELLGARKAYHSLYNLSIEEDVAFLHVNDSERKFLVALVSSYRYEGLRVNEQTAKSEAQALHDAIQNAEEISIFENYDVVIILSTRSKLHLKAVFKHYKEITGKSFLEDLRDELILKTTVECLCTPEIYFSEALDAAMKEGANEFTQEGLTRILICHADANLKDIRGEYQNRYGVDLKKKIENRARGNYRDFLLSLVARGE
ncbi:hypothetical protein V2J09_012097 [Rumex salicifolius]